MLSIGVYQDTVQHKYLKNKAADSLSIKQKSWYLSFLNETQCHSPDQWHDPPHSLSHQCWKEKKNHIHHNLKTIEHWKF